MFKQNDIVKYSHIYVEGEEKYRFIVLDAYEGNVKIGCLNTSLIFGSIERVHESELVLCNEDDYLIETWTVTDYLKKGAR